MSLEKVDIQDVMSEVAQGRLVHIKLNDENSLHAAVACLEQKDFGDISIWSPEKLFQIEKPCVRQRIRLLRNAGTQP